jgi:preprotein translocase subunit YajC
MSHTKTIRTDQRGIVSLIMTLVMMIIISLIVLGLAQMSRREQRQSLDNQLSLQAFYAAESGVNDAVAAAQQSLTSSGKITTTSGCHPTVGTIDLSTINVSAANNVAYTCVLVANSGSLTGDLSKVLTWPLQMTDGSAIGTANFSWTETANPPTTATANCPATGAVTANTEFSNNGTWNGQCPYGVLRLDLVPVSSVNQASLIDNTMTMFVVPTNNGSLSTVGFNPGHNVYSASCDTSKCQININFPGTKYYVRAMEIYNDGQFTISPPAGKTFTGAQISVDATGKAQDVLRRIKESVNINTGNTNALGSQPIISGDSVCKRWAIYQNSSINAANSVGECK